MASGGTYGCFPLFVAAASLLVNLLLFIFFFFFFSSSNNFFGPYNLRKPLGWNLEAALEAEAVSTISCSGHGEGFVDGIVVDGVPVCECHECYGGPDCSKLDANCVVNVSSCHTSPFLFPPCNKQTPRGDHLALHQRCCSAHQRCATAHNDIRSP